MASKKISLFLILFFLFNISYATHIRGGYIKAERLSFSSLTFRIELIVFTDKGSPDNINFGNGIMDFGDGSNPIVRPREMNDPRVISVEENVDSIGLDIQFNRIIFEHRFPANFTSYLISYQEPNRNEGIINIPNSVQVPFYIETFILLDEVSGFNDLPSFVFPSTYIIKSGTENKFSASAVELEDDSLSYRLVIPRQNRGEDVAGYSFPGSGRLDGSDVDSPFFINSVSGLITWENPLMTGEYVVSVLVEEWRKFEGDFTLISFSVNDFQLIVEDFSDSIPSIELNNQVCVTVGEEVSETITFSNNESSRLDFIHDESFPLEFSASSGISIENGFEMQVNWMPEEEFFTETPYVIVFRNQGSIGISRFEEMVLSFSCDNFQLDNFNDTIVSGSIEPPESNVILSTSVNEEPSLSVYPNPVVNSIIIESDQISNYEASLISISGVETRLFPMEYKAGNRLEVQLNPELSNGIYILQIQTEDNHYTERILIDR